MDDSYHIVLAVTAFIYSEQKGILIIHKAPTQRVDGGLWTCPGGKVNPEEAILDALTREVKEEVGLKVTSHEWIGEDVFPVDSSCYHAQHFLCSVQEPSRVVLEEGFLDYAWVKKVELDNYIFHPNLRKRILELFDRFSAM